MPSSFIKKWNTTFTILLIIFLNTRQVLVDSAPQVPCYFIFGDSLVDNGNNNPRLVTAKANYPPYGIDFPGGPSGRFTNGRTIADLIAEHLGFDKFIPPFATAKGKEIINGVNYGSGSAGILDATGRHQGDVISMKQQIHHHQITVTHLSKLLRGASNTWEHLHKCLYTVGMGNNDYINNYLMPEHYNSSILYSNDQFANLLAQQYYLQLTRLHILGARKVAVFGFGKIGSIPMYASKGAKATDSINKAVQLADEKIKPMVDELNQKLPGAKFTYINMTSIAIGDPTPYGIKVLDSPCCKVSTTAAVGQCILEGATCSNRSENVFFDNFHPTEMTNKLTVARAIKSFLPTDAYPFDISNLIQDSTNNNIQPKVGKAECDNGSSSSC